MILVPFIPSGQAMVRPILQLPGLIWGTMTWHQQFL